MTYSLLAGLKIVEISAFVAAPLAGLTLAQLGAEVIRIDPPRGAIDYTRWPLAADGSSLYWQGLNRSKRSICVDLKQPQGQQILQRLLNSNGSDGGVLLTNLTGPDWLSFEQLTKARSDLVMVALTGHHDGTAAVDYTVNAAVGIPFATGPQDTTGPVNHMLPAWDGIAGLTLATALLAAVRARDKTGLPQHLSVALSDVAMGFISNLGITAEAELTDTDRARIGNHVYGTFGHSLKCSDNRYVMVVAITGRHWIALVNAAGIEGAIDQLERAHHLDLTTDKDRYALKEEIEKLLSSWAAKHNFATISKTLNDHGALWGPYQSVTQMLNEDPRASIDNPLFQIVEHPAIGPHRVTGSTIRVKNMQEGKAVNTSKIGTDTFAVLKESGYNDTEIEQLIHTDTIKKQSV